MNVIRVRKVSDGEELVLTEELWGARLELGYVDPRVASLERRKQALSDPQSSTGRAIVRKATRLRAKAKDWSF